VGAGAVGLAVGYALAARGESVVLMEKQAGVGQGVSSRNSEVIHSGLYYPTGSLRAQLCVDGRRKLYPFLQAHGVAHAKCGKLIVATENREIEQLEGIADRAMRNGVEGFSWLTGSEARALEPELACVAALLSPETGLMDSHGYMLALLGEIEANGGVLATHTPFLGAAPSEAGGFSIRTGGEAAARFNARMLVVAAGLGAQTSAAAIEGYPVGDIPRQRLGKGVYFRLVGRAPFQRLIYPPPVPGALGTHYTRDLGGQARFGPDLEFVDAENYDVDPAKARRFYVDIRRYWPALPDGALTPDFAAIRPKIHGPGEPQPDFRIDGSERHGLPGLVTLFGIESPGLTSSLAIGEMVAARLSD